MRFVLFLLLAFIGSAQAQIAGSRLEPPSCFLTNGARGYTMQMQDSGDLDASWWCPDGWGDWRMFRLAQRSGTVIAHPVPAFLTLDVEQVGAAYWKANVKQTCDGTTDVKLIDLCAAAMRRGLQTLPPPPYVVRTNGSYATRPTYPVVNGVRSTVSNGTVQIRDADGRGVACNPAQAIREGSSTYMQVKRTLNTVALCTAS